MHKWFYTREGRNIGPVSTKSIVDAVLNGIIELDTTILSDQDKMWKPVKDIPEIMDLIHKPLPHPVFDDIAPAHVKDFYYSDIELQDTEPIFYNIPAKRLLLMQLITFGMFEFYWFYKQWNYLRFHSKRRRGSYFLASIYLILFAYEVFFQIETHKELNKVKRAPWNARTLALLWYLVIPLLAFNPLQSLPLISGMLSYLVVFLLTSLVLMPVQSYINDVNAILQRPESKPSFGFYLVTALSLIAVVVIILMGRSVL